MAAKLKVNKRPVEDSLSIISARVSFTLLLERGCFQFFIYIFIFLTITSSLEQHTGSISLLQMYCNVIRINII
jgi:hypothetical protein